MALRRARVPRVVRASASAALAVGLLLFGLPLFADVGDAWHQVQGMSSTAVGLLAFATALNLLTYWWLLVASLPGLKLTQAAVACEASTAVNNVLPAGAVAGAGLAWSMYRSYGFTPEEIGRSMSLAAFWNSAVKLLTPAVALLFLAAGPDAPSGFLVVISLGAFFGAAVATASVLRRDRALDRLVSAAAAITHRRYQAAEWSSRMRAARARSLALVRRRWLALSMTAVASHAALFVVLLLSVRAVGIGQSVLGLGEVLTAFAVVRVALLVPITPGGAGVAEIGLTGMLTAAGGEASAVVGAVLLFRALTWFLPIPLGGLAYTVWLLGRPRVIPSAGA